MNKLKTYFSIPYLSWRLIEWILIFAGFPAIFIFGNQYTVRPERINFYITFSLIFCLLSFIFPVDRPVWQKRIYIIIEITLINLALSYGVHLELLMYFILAKACFILKRQDAIIAIVATGISNIIIYARTVPIFQAETREYIRINGTEKFFHSLAESIIYYLTEYIAISFFLTLFMFLLVSESKSRKRAEQLAKEVELLATVVERNRIARDIHDSLGHTLTSLAVQLELAEKTNSINSIKSIQALQNARQLADRSLKEVRTTISAIRDEDFNLEKAIIALIEQFRKDGLFEIRIQMNLPYFTLQTSHQIYCIIKEILYNVQKHSRANLVIIDSQTTTQNTIIQIADNGIGFDSSLVNSGSGLQGIIERSHLINGQLIIDTGVGRGTVIQLIINN